MPPVHPCLPCSCVAFSAIHFFKQITLSKSYHSRAYSQLVGQYGPVLQQHRVTVSPAATKIFSVYHEKCAKFSAVLGGGREQVKYPAGFSRWSMMAPSCIADQGKSMFSLCNVCAHTRGANSQSEPSKLGWRISWNILPQKTLFWNSQFCTTAKPSLVNWLWKLLVYFRLHEFCHTLQFCASVCSRGTLCNHWKPACHVCLHL